MKKLTVLFALCFIFIFSGKGQLQWSHYPKVTSFSNLLKADTAIVFIKYQSGILKHSIQNNSNEIISFPLKYSSDLYYSIFQVDNNNDVWAAGTGLGLWKYSNGQWSKIYTPTDDISNFFINDLGQIVITNNTSIAFYDLQNWTIYDQNNSIFKGGYIQKIDATDNKFVFSIYDNNGLLVFDGQYWTKIDSTNYPIKNMVGYGVNNCFAINKNDEILILNELSIDHQYFVRIDSNYSYTLDSVNSFISTTNYYYNPTIRGSKVDNGFFLSNQTANMVYGFDKIIGVNGFRFNGRYSIYHDYIEDSRGDIWALYDTICLKVDKNTMMVKDSFIFKNCFPVNFTNDGTIFATMTDYNNHAWFGSYNSYKTWLFEFNGNRFFEYDLSKYDDCCFNFRSIGSMVSDKVNLKNYFGTQNATIISYDGTNWSADTILNIPTNLYYPTVSALAIDRNNRLLAGFQMFWNSIGAPVIPMSPPGIAIQNGNNWDLEVLTDFGCSTNTIFSIAVDTFNGKNDYWIGTKGGGIMKRIGVNNYVHYTKNNSPIPEDTVVNISIDNFGRKWIATSNGLAIYNDTTWTVYSVTNSPFQSNEIEYVAFNPFDNYTPWVATKKGAYVYKDSCWIGFSQTNSGLNNDDIESISFDNQCGVWFPSENEDYSSHNQYASLDRLEMECNFPAYRISGIIQKPDGTPSGNHKVEAYKKNGNSLLYISQAYTDNTGYYNLTVLDSTDIYIKSTGDNITEVPTYGNNTYGRQYSNRIHFTNNKANLNIRNSKMNKTIGNCIIAGEIINGKVILPNTNLYLLSTTNNDIVASFSFPNNLNFFAFQQLDFGSYRLCIDRFGVIDTLSPIITVSPALPVITNLEFLCTQDRLEFIEGTINTIPTEPTFRQISISPNPTNNYLAISIDKFREIDELTVSFFDILGNLIKEEKLITKETLYNTSHWQKGHYFYLIKQKNILIQSGKIIKE